MKTETYTTFEIDGIEIIGMVGRSGNFLITQIHDTYEKRAFYFNGCSVLDYAKDMDNTFIESISATIVDDTYLQLTDDLSDNLPAVATQPIPLDGADKGFILTLIKTCQMATEELDDEEPDYELAPLHMD